LQPKHGPIRIAAVCDHEAGQYLLIATGWENKQRVDCILLHARLVGGKIVIETDNTEDGLKPALREAGVPAEDIITGSSLRRQESQLVAA
jgi:hypothetical protein